MNMLQYVILPIPAFQLLIDVVLIPSDEDNEWHKSWRDDTVKPGHDICYFLLKFLIACSPTCVDIDLIIASVKI